jgi:hypothetical protein
MLAAWRAQPFLSVALTSLRDLILIFSLQAEEMQVYR